jgi:hypothetical protein
MNITTKNKSNKDNKDQDEEMGQEMKLYKILFSKTRLF